MPQTDGILGIRTVVDKQGNAITGIRDVVDTQATVITSVKNAVDQQSVVCELAKYWCLQSNWSRSEHPTTEIIALFTG
jgi:hypothetical protein